MRNLTKYSLFLVLLACLTFSCAPSRTTTNMWRDLDHSRELDMKKGNRSHKIYNQKARNYSKKITSHNVASYKRH